MRKQEKTWPFHRMTPLLQVRDLHVAYGSRRGGDYAALAGVSFEVQRGECLGVLGESGSGKSTLAAALLRLLPANGLIQKGAVHFEGEDVLGKTSEDLQKLRGGRIAIIFQEPSLALHPTIRVGEQIGEVIAAHERLDRHALRQKTVQVLASVFSDEAGRIAKSFPHQLSGGQRQRVLLAQAISCGPALLIADEPTASLDPSTQQEILSLLQRLRQQLNLAMILISHNPAVLASHADRLLVLYAGKIAEMGPTKNVLSSPQHPYTRALLRSLPPQFEKELAQRKNKLAVIAGDPPNPAQPATGCRFEPRCTERMDVCAQTEPQETIAAGGHAVSCFKYGAE